MIFASTLYIPLMRKALELASLAASSQEVPIGALVYSMQLGIIGLGYNSVIRHNDPTAHAEIIALRRAAQSIQNYRIVDSIIVTTLEPCSMCVGAIIHARIRGIVYGTSSTKTGALGGAFSLLQFPKNHHIWVVSNILAEECASVLHSFFADKRTPEKKS